MVLFPIGLIVLLVAYPIVAHSKSPLDQTQAVELAEQFVSKNGYADETRANSIMGRAVVARIKTVNGRTFWSVLFLFRQQVLERQYDFGREVRVSLNGSRVWMGQNGIAVWRAHIMGDCLGEEKEKPNP
jgi:hypothetical protein